MSLGRQAGTGHPDLLFIGMSSTDYYGHNFGPDSKEMADGIVRLDATLEAFFRWLDEKVAPKQTLIFVTGDHGVQPIPQVAIAKHRKATGRENAELAGRVDFNDGPGEAATVGQASEPRRRLEMLLAKKNGYELRMDGPNASEAAVLPFEEPSLYLNRAVLARRGVALEIKRTLGRAKLFPW